MAFIRSIHGIYTGYGTSTSNIRPIYGLFMAFIRHIYGIYTAYERPIDGPNTAYIWPTYGLYVKIRHCMVEDLLANPPLLGGMEKIVELDESLIGNIKYNRGRLRKGQCRAGQQHLHQLFPSRV